MAKAKKECKDAKLQKFYIDMFKKYKKKIKVEFILLTPKLAAEFSKKNKDNYRPKSDKNLSNICMDIMKKFWTITGETIVFNEKNQMVDGQHRVDSVLKTGISLPCFVIYGVPCEAKNATGQAAPRRLWHKLRNQGESHPILLQAVLNLSWKLDPKVKIKQHRRPTDQHALEYLENNRDIIRGVDRYCKVSFEGPISTTAAAYAYYILSKIDEDKAANFVDTIFHGNILLPKTHPISILRKFIWDSRQRGSIMRSKHCVSLMFRTWNAIKRKEKLTNNMLLKSIPELTKPF